VSTIKYSLYEVYDEVFNKHHFQNARRQLACVPHVNIGALNNFFEQGILIDKLDAIVPTVSQCLESMAKPLMNSSVYQTVKNSLMIRDDSFDRQKHPYIFVELFSDIKSGYLMAEKLQDPKAFSSGDYSEEVVFQEFIFTTDPHASTAPNFKISAYHVYFMHIITEETLHKVPELIEDYMLYVPSKLMHKRVSTKCVNILDPKSR
jgi:hypothetical protein